LAIPDYQAAMLPVLRAFSDGVPKGYAEILSAVADEFHLSEEERSRAFPSGKGTVWRTRVGWAVTYLREAGLLRGVRRGVHEITTEGAAVIASQVAFLDIGYLRRFPSFVSFLERSQPKPKGSEVKPSEVVDTPDSTPEEDIEGAVIRLRKEVEQHLALQTQGVSPKFFENLVVELLLSMGYGGNREEAGATLGKSGDGGVDGVINEDRLGLDVVYVQAKRWSAPVGRPEVQRFAGALHGFRAKKGVFITTSSFTRDAVAYAAQIDTRIVLVDGEKLSELMFEHDLGVSTRNQYVVKQIDAEYFDET
jgi:restriction system protein